MPSNPSLPLAQLRPLLDQALALTPPERADWLAQVRRHYPAVAPELEALLAQEADLDARGFLDGEVWHESPTAQPIQ